MKVLELCLSTGVGGLELYAVRTATQLLARNIECVGAVTSGTLTAKRMQQVGVPLIVMEHASRVLPLFAARKLASIIDEQQIDIIHMHWARDLSLASLAKRFARRPVKLIYTRQMMLTRPKKDTYHKFLYRQVDLFLTITNELRELARGFLPLSAQAIQTLYYGVEQPPQLDAQQKAELRSKLKIEPDVFAIGMIGRIEKGKGQHLVLQALQQLQEQGIQAHVTFIGPVMNQAYMNQLEHSAAQQQLLSQVTFYGAHDNPIELMSVFDVVVLATKQETFGLVLIEAMRNGVAVIGTNAGGVPEIIDDGVTGLLFEPDNAADLAAKLMLICGGRQSDKQRLEELASAGKAKADNQFSQEQHYDRLLEYMNNLVTHHHNRSAN